MEKVYINQKTVQKYFYYGIIDKLALEEGLIFYSTSRVHIKTCVEDKSMLINLIDVKDMNEEERRKYYREYNEKVEKRDRKLKERNLQELIKQVSRIYKQYYRFIVLPDFKQNYTMEISEDQMLQIVEHIREKIMQLKQEGKLDIYPLGIFFTREQEDIYTEKSWVEDFKTFKMGYYKNWTQDVYEVLESLARLEEQNPQEYQERWINIRLTRAKNRNIPDEIEINNIQKLKEIFEKKKEEYSKSSKTIEAEAVKNR